MYCSPVKTELFRFVAKLFLALFCFCCCAASPGDVSVLEGLVDDLLELQDIANRYANDWEEQKRRLDYDVSLLRREKDALEKRLADENGRLVKQRELLRELETRRDELKAVLSKARDALAAAGTRLEAILPGLPLPLRKTVRRSLETIGEEPAGNTPGGQIAHDLQVVLSIFSEIREFGHGMNSTSLLLTDPDGVRRNMDVLFLGIGAAFAVSPTGEIGAAGRPGLHGWQWEWNDELAPEIRRALSIYKGELPASFVRLPLHYVPGKPEFDDRESSIPE